jgi:nicotinamide-nucleotide adenylyltransferase
MKRALLLGRYQPLHKGHLQAIQDIINEEFKLVIAVGSAQTSHTLDNPFTAGERHLMITEALEAEGIQNFEIIPIMDINRYAVWVSHVESLVPPIEVVFSNNPLTKRLFSEKGYEVKAQQLYERDKYSGTEVRRRILVGENWQELVPEAVIEAVIKVIENIKGVERIKELGE